MNDCGGLFDGVGLLAYGLHLAGWQHAWLCESDEWRRGILAKRWPGVPIVPDVRDVGADTVRPVTLVAGGFPCKGASTAGKREGFDHAETVLWREMRRAVGELRPRYVLVENVANILALHDGAVWGEVLGDLAALGYDTVWDCLPAAAVGAPHLRDRVFAVATHTDGAGWPAGRQSEHPQRSGSGHFPDEVVAASPDPGGDGVRQQPEPESGRGGRALAGRASAAATDADCGGGEAGAQQDQRPTAGQRAPLGHDADRRGVRVEWGSYEPAIRRWEQVAGPAPEPLVRRVDDRGAARVERSRLSALGDGVQVQVGYLAGAYIAGLERERMREAA